jgi:hypothetical protein
MLSPWFNVGASALLIFVAVQSWRRSERWSAATYVTLALMMLDLAANRMRLFDSLLLDYAVYVLVLLALVFWWKGWRDHARTRAHRSQ